MILSVSRRTDIPAFYSEWFMNRLREGFLLVRNPMNYHQVSKIILNPQLIDCIVFWTKNPLPIIPHLEKIHPTYPFYFQYTLNAYGTDIEPFLPPLNERLQAMRHISDTYGPERMIWRYDPILLTERYSVEWHISQFATIAAHLCGKINTCVFSFVDLYEKVKRNFHNLPVRTCTEREMNQIACAFSDIANRNGFRLRTCSEAVDLSTYGIEHGCCVDGDLIAKITGWVMKGKKDTNQRAECGCLESVDIGQYNTCRHGCRYCYANVNPQMAITLSHQHDPASPLILGQVDPEDKINERKIKSLKQSIYGQQSMF